MKYIITNIFFFCVTEKQSWVVLLLWKILGHHIYLFKFIIEKSEITVLHFCEHKSIVYHYLNCSYLECRFWCTGGYSWSWGFFYTLGSCSITQQVSTMPPIVTPKRNNSKIYVPEWNLHRKTNKEKMDWHNYSLRAKLDFKEDEENIKAYIYPYTNYFILRHFIYSLNYGLSWIMDYGLWIITVHL